MNGTYIVINQKKKLMNVTFNVFYATSLLQKKNKSFTYLQATSTTSIQNIDSFFLTSGERE